MAERISNLAAQLRPYWLRDVAAGTEAAAGVGSSGLVAHALSGPYHTGTLAEGQAPWAATKTQISGLAGAGLTYDGIALNVGAGNGITVNADDVALASSVAGNGLTYSSGVLAVGVANTGGTGLTVEADAVRLTSYSDRTGSASGVLYASSGNLKLTTQNISSTIGYNGTFTSGFAGAGWQVDYGVTEAAKASATFDNLTIRGRMRVYELLIQQIRATNGSVLVTSSSKALTVTADDDPLWTVNGVQLTFNGANATLETTLYAITTSTSTEAGADRTHYHGFLVGDLIRAQQVEWDGSEFGGVYQSNLEVTGVTNLYTYQAARVDTASDAPAVGYDFVRLGSASDTTRQGVVYLTSDDSNAPFIDIVDGVASHAQWNTAGKIRARLGKLSGITDDEWGALDGYGLWSDNVYLTGSIFATDGIFNGTVYATDGIFSGTVYASAGTFTGAITAQSGSIDGFLTLGSSGGIYQGTGTAGTPTTGLKIWNDSGVGRIGGYNSGNLQWYASTTGYFYSGSGTMRIGNDDLRMNLGTYDGDYDDYRTIKWVPSIDGTDTARTDFDYRSDITSWASATDDVTLSLSVRANAADYDSRDANLVLAANNWNGSSLSQASIYIVQENSTTSYNSYIGLFSKYLYVTRNSAPSGTPSAGFCFVWVDSSTNTLKMKDSSGTTRSVTFS